MDNVLLRILTENSQWKYGKYSDLKIGEILETDKSYLVWMYYHISNISFCPELLEKLGIRPITKPGIDLRAYKQLKKDISAEFTDEERFHGRQKLYHKRKKQKMADYISFIYSTRETKSKRQYYHHGHK